jgi:hypothetical protein
MGILQGLADDPEAEEHDNDARENIRLAEFFLFHHDESDPYIRLEVNTWVEGGDTRRAWVRTGPPGHPHRSAIG